jgi:non-specific serine/threonine protein kinase
MVMTPTLHIQLLGGFRLISGETAITTVELPRLQSLLAYLLLYRGAPHPRQQLAFLLWPDSTEGQARSNLRTLISRLRGALPSADAFLPADSHSLQWRLDAPWTLDVADFERALALAEHTENVVAIRAALERAVELYRGDLLPSCYDDWVLPERERLRQRFLSALERLILALEQLRDYPAAIQYAQRLLRHDPLHEATYQHLMRLHALTGDRASALRVYQTCVTVLRRELDIEPSSATRAVYDRLALLEPQASPASAPAHESAVLHNLPIPLTSFIGRSRERAEVARLLATTRLLTLTGAGGCGKTRLALTVATDQAAAYPDGVALVELAALADQALVPQAVAAALGVREEPQRPLSATLVSTLRAKELLLVLDNCEHLVATCAQLIQTLLSACPRLRILATSREALGVAGETTWLVPSLSLPAPKLTSHSAAEPEDVLADSEAVSLFVERATAALPTFAMMRENAAAVERICRQLDGIPLAIELAAARVKLLTAVQIAARLHDCFQLLTTGSRTAMPRQQTLRAAIDWSYDLLAEPERALFRRLAVFAGGWTLEAAEAVCADRDADIRMQVAERAAHPAPFMLAPSDVLELLAHLVDKSLVVVDTPPGGESRYRLLETVRQYSQEKLRDAIGDVAVRRRHADYFLRLAEEAELALWGPQQVAWLERLEREHENLRGALQWSEQQGELELTARLAGALWRFWEAHNYLSEGRRWLELALNSFRLPIADCRLEEVDQSTIYNLRSAMNLRVKVLNGAGILANDQGDYARARELLEESLLLCRAAGDKRSIAATLNHLAAVAWFQADHAQHRAISEECYNIYRELGDRRGIARSLAGLGHAAFVRRDYQRALAFYEESIALYRELGEPQGIALTLCQLAAAAWHCGYYQRAYELYAESLVRFRDLRALWGVAYCLDGCAMMAITQEPPIARERSRAVPAEQARRAARLWGAAEALREVAGFHLSPVDRSLYGDYIEAGRASIDETSWAAAWAGGRAVTLDQATVEVLQIVDELKNPAREASAS